MEKFSVDLNSVSKAFVGKKNREDKLLFQNVMFVATSQTAQYSLLSQTMLINYR